MPRVSVRNSVRKPISPRAGTSDVHANPAAAVVDERLGAALAEREELRQRPRGTPRARRSTPASTGSCTVPSISRVTTCGLPTVSSKPSRAHLLDEHRELELAATLHLPRVRPTRSEATRSETLPTSSEWQPALDARLARQLVARQSRERRRVDADRHRQRRLVDRDHRERPRVVGIGERLADRHVREPRDGDDLAGPGLVRLDPVERLGDVELGHLRALDRPVRAAPGDRLRLPDRPPARPGRARAGRRTGEASRLVTSACSGWPSS